MTRVKQLYPDLYAKEVKRTPTSWNRLRNTAERRWFNQHPNNLESIYDYWHRTGNTYKTVWRTFGYLRLPGWRANIYTCIFQNESSFRHDVWFGHSRGWQNGRFEGTSTVNGTGQLKPGWANGFIADPDGPYYYLDDTVTPATFHITSDPIASTIISARIGLGPFFAQAGRCF